MAPQIDEVDIADEVAIPSSEAMPASVETTSELLYVDLQDTAGEAVTNTEKSSRQLCCRVPTIVPQVGYVTRPTASEEARREIPKRMLRIGNEILTQVLQRRNSKSLTSLNVAVYAIAKVIVTKAMKDYAERMRPQKERLLEAVEQRKTLIKFISVLTNELRRRRAVNEGVRGSRPRPTAPTAR